MVGLRPVRYVLLALQRTNKARPREHEVAKFPNLQRGGQALFPAGPLGLVKPPKNLFLFLRTNGLAPPSRPARPAAQNATNRCDMADAAAEGRLKPTDTIKLTLEAWSQGFMVGALIIMCGITLSVMRRGVLLHKLILIEVSKASPVPSLSLSLTRQMPGPATLISETNSFHSFCLPSPTASSYSLNPPRGAGSSRQPSSRSSRRGRSTT